MQFYVCLGPHYLGLPAISDVNDWRFCTCACFGSVRIKQRVVYD